MQVEDEYHARRKLREGIKGAKPDRSMTWAPTLWIRSEGALWLPPAWTVCLTDLVDERGRPRRRSPEIKHGM